MIFYILAGILFGMIGGMGMGGGIILIPVLTLLLGESQHMAQALNLTAFLPMSVFALFLHIRSKRVDIRYALLMALFGGAGALAGAFLANLLDEALLKKFFGGFLILLAVLRIRKKYRKNR